MGGRDRRALGARPDLDHIGATGAELTHDLRELRPGNPALGSTRAHLRAMLDAQPWSLAVDPRHTGPPSPTEAVAAPDFADPRPAALRATTSPTVILVPIADAKEETTAA
jgi:hypothetical protein